MFERSRTPQVACGGHQGERRATSRRTVKMIKGPKKPMDQMSER
ncbi:MAG TPA: hypothetical protein VD966_13140 [Pyrinomonadaceae bacterium]|nr:hypothetical protein [Pyrinomonadaceae bacterium]